ncbi:MAG TPA: hypothetical protein VE978_01745 [Chitinophagales bacterium]|nr:hypothetical protein [Chitinophagales bacterium]
MKIICFLFIIIAFVSCKKDSVWYVNTHVYNAVLKVTVSRDTLVNGSIQKIPLRYAIVSLFLSDDDRETHQNQVIAGETDANGFVAFYHLTENYYYIKSWHYIYGEQFSQASTLDATINDIEIAY